MVPSMCAVDGSGRSLTPGLLYGDARAGTAASADPSQSGESVGFLRWCAAHAPEASGFWPAQAMANFALCGEAVLDTTTAMTMVPLFDYVGWDESVAREAGVRTDQLPRIVPGDQPAARVPDGLPAGGAVLGGGTVDALGEQLVAGADHDGDVLVILGATLICWAVIPEWREVDGLWTIPHTAAGLSLIGGPSNAGGLFLDWVRRLTGDPEPSADPVRVPVWTPYPRGERVPLHDPARRAGLHDLDLTHGAARGAARRPRSGRFRDPPPTRPGRACRHGASSPPAAARGRRAGSRPSPTPPGSRSMSSPFPRVRRSAPPSRPASSPASRPTPPTPVAGPAPAAASSPIRPGSAPWPSGTNASAPTPTPRPDPTRHRRTRPFWSVIGPSGATDDRPERLLGGVAAPGATGRR